MKNAEKHNVLGNVLNYNSSTKAVLPGTDQKAITKKLARLEIKIPGPTI